MPRGPPPHRRHPHPRLLGLLLLLLPTKQQRGAAGRAGREQSAAEELVALAALHPTRGPCLHPHHLHWSTAAQVKAAWAVVLVLVLLLAELPAQAWVPQLGRDQGRHRALQLGMPHLPLIVPVLALAPALGMATALLASVFPEPCGRCSSTQTLIVCLQLKGSSLQWRSACSGVEAQALPSAQALLQTLA